MTSGILEASTVLNVAGSQYAQVSSCALAIGQYLLVSSMFAQNASYSSKNRRPKRPCNVHSAMPITIQSNITVLSPKKKGSQSSRFDVDLGYDLLF